MYHWSVTYETARVARGIVATRREALTAAGVEEAARIAVGLDPDKLAWHVRPVVIVRPRKVVTR